MSVGLVEYVLISPPHSFRTQTFAYPESTTDREEILQGLEGRIEDIKSVSVVHVYKGTEYYLCNTDAITSIYPFFCNVCITIETTRRRKHSSNVGFLQITIFFFCIVLLKYLRMHTISLPFTSGVVSD